MSRNNNFVVLHWLGALLVVLGHQYVLLGDTAPAILGMPAHGLGVRIMFIVSGYLIAESYKRCNAYFTYLFKRIVRIFPALIFCLLFSTIILRGFSTISTKAYIVDGVRYVLRNSVLWPTYPLGGVFADNIYPDTINGSLWTLPVEFLCFLILPVLLKIYQVLKSKSKEAGIIYGLLLLAIIMLSCTKSMLFPNDHTYIFWGTEWKSSSMLINCFFIGSVFNMLEIKRFLSVEYSFLLLFVWQAVPSRLLDIAGILILPYSLLSFAYARQIKVSVWLDNKEWFYGFYLWAFVVQQIAVQVFIVQKRLLILTPNIWFVICSVITLILAIITFYAVEKPIGNWAKRLTKKEFVE